MSDEKRIVLANIFDPDEDHCTRLANLVCDLNDACPEYEFWIDDWDYQNPVIGVRRKEQ